MRTLNNVSVMKVIVITKQILFRYFAENNNYNIYKQTIGVLVYYNFFLVYKVFSRK